MATVERNSVRTRRKSFALSEKYPRANQPLHRVARVRLEQGLSLRSVSRQSGIDVRELRCQEEETTDMRLSELHGWQRILDVPIGDLLVDPGSPLSRPVLERARLVRLMKTVMAIAQQASSTSIQRLAQTMVDQLVEIMPELDQVSAWNSVGQRRSLSEYGIAAERCVSEDVFLRNMLD